MCDGGQGLTVMVAQRIKSHWIWFINLLMSLVGVGSLIFLISDFDYIEGSSVQVLMSTVLAILPATILIEVRNPQDYRRFSPIMLGLMLLSLCFVAIAIGDRYSISLLVLNGFSSVLSLPLLFAHWCIARRNRILMIAVVPTVAMGFIYLTAEILQPDTADLYLLLLPFVLFIGLIWAFLAQRSLKCAKGSRHRPLLGPLTESITMFLLVVPLAVLAMFSVNAAMEEDVWVAVAGILVGFLFSNAVSTPFRNFLRVLGGLEENTTGPIDEPRPH